MAKRNQRRLSRQAKMKRLLERDHYKCGEHSGGCGGPIDPKETNERRKSTVDHILPRSYTRSIGILQQFEKPWNRQPTHQECNSDRGGQIVDWPDLKCACHCTYMEENGKRHFMYRTPDGWRQTAYWDPDRSGSHREKHIIFKDPENGTAFHEIHVILEQRHGIIAASLKHELGHLMNKIGTFRRIRHNAFELARTKQWGRLTQEAEAFANAYLKDGGAALRTELKDDWESTIAKIIQWSRTAASADASSGTPGSNIKALMAAAEYDGAAGAAIRSEVEAYASGQSTGTEEKFLPVGWIEINLGQPARAMANEAWKRVIAGDLRGGMAIAERAIQAYPNRSEGWELRGRLKELTGDYLGAVRDLNQAIRIAPRATSYAARATANARAGNRFQAIRDIQQAQERAAREDQEGNSFHQIHTGKTANLDAILRELSIAEQQIRYS